MNGLFPAFKLSNIDGEANGEICHKIYSSVHSVWIEKRKMEKLNSTITPVIKLHTLL